jgi:hypothetical protein
MSLHVNAGPSITLSGPELLEIAALVKRGVDHMERLDSITPALNTVRELYRVANEYRNRMSSQPRHGPVTSPPDKAPSDQSIEPPNEITVAQAAEIIGLSDRQVWRLVKEPDLALAIVRTDPMRLDRQLVEAYKLHRDEKRNAA